MRSTCSRVSVLMLLSLLFMILETVEVETPASFAISLIVMIKYLTIRLYEMPYVVIIQ